MVCRYRVFACLASVAMVAGLTIGCNNSPQAKEARYLKLGQDRLAKGDSSRAILEFRNAAKAMPRDAEPQYQLGLAFLRSGDIRSAAVTLRKATELNPKHEGAQLALSQLLTISTDQKVLEDAAARLQSVLHESPDNPTATTALAMTEWRLGKTEDAEKRLRDALQKAPTHFRASLDLARIKFKQKDVNGAVEVMQKAADSAPQSEAGAAVGELYLMLDRLDDAEREFRRTLQSIPKDGPALLGLAVVQIARNRLDEAEQTLRQVAALPDKHYKPQHAIFFYRTGKRDAALAEFRKLAAEAPDDRDARTRLVGAYVEMGRVPEALGVLAAALKGNPKDSDALLQEGELYLRQGKVTQAENNLKAVLHSTPNSASAHAALAAVYEAQGMALSGRQELNEALRLNPGLLDARLSLARNLLDSDAKMALKVVDETPAQQNKTPAVLIERNWILLKLGNAKDVRTALNEALKAGRPVDLVLQDAVLKFTERDYDGALAAAEEVIKRNPEEVRAARVIAYSYVAQKRPSLASERLAQIAGARPNSAPLQLLLGRWYISAGNLPAARKTLEATKAANPKFLPADLALSDVDIRENRKDAAKERIEGIIRKDPKNIDALLNLAKLFEASGDRASASERYQAVLDVDGSNLFALNNLAYDLAFTSPDEALKLAERALEVAPGNPEVQDTLGWIYYRKAIYSSAVTYLKEAVAKESTPQRQFHLGMAYLKLGDRKLGQTLLGTALQKDPNLLRTEQGW
jgi:tetratricopeptide (TPR) repeat protein